MAKDEAYEVNLGNLNGGQILEAAQDAMAKVLANIRDPNTDPEQKRELIIKVQFSPNRNRDHASVVAKVNTKLAGVEPSEGSLFISGVNGRIKGYVRDIAQDELFTQNQTAINDGKKPS